MSIDIVRPPSSSQDGLLTVRLLSTGLPSAGMLHVATSAGVAYGGPDLEYAFPAAESYEFNVTLRPAAAGFWSIELVRAGDNAPLVNDWQTRVFGYFDTGVAVASGDVGHLFDHELASPSIHVTYDRKDVPGGLNITYDVAPAAGAPSWQAHAWLESTLRTPWSECNTGSQERARTSAAAVQQLAIGVPWSVQPKSDGRLSDAAPCSNSDGEVVAEFSYGASLLVDFSTKGTKRGAVAVLEVQCGLVRIVASEGVIGRLVEARTYESPCCESMPPLKGTESACSSLPRWLLGNGERLETPSLGGDRAADSPLAALLAIVALAVALVRRRR